MTGEGQGQGQGNFQGQGGEQAGQGQGNFQGQGQGQFGDGQGNYQGQGGSDDAKMFRYSDTTSMQEFFRDYPQYANNPNFTKYKTVKDFASGYESLVSRLGTAVNIPNQYSTQEQIDEFYNKLGRPESADNYQFQDKLPEGFEIDEKLDASYRDLAYQIGLTSTQAQKLRDFYNSAVEAAYLGNQKEVQTRLAQAHEQNVNEIKEMWGGDYKAKTKIAMNTARAVLSQDTLDYLDATGLGNNAKLIADFYELSKKLSGDNHLVDGGGYIPQEPTLENLESESMKILRTPNWMNDPALKRRYEELTQQRADILYK